MARTAAAEPLWRNAVAAVLLAGLVSGCTINPRLELIEVVGPEPAVQLSSVPFFPQADYQCGPASLAGVLGAAGVETDPATLSPQVYLPGRQGSLQLELLAATRRAGRIPYLLGNTSGALIRQLEAGRPVLVLQNLGTRHFPVWHYAVLVGFDARANQLFLNSGGEQGLAVAAPEFLRSWDWAGRWAMVALRPGDLPPRPDPSRYVEAVASFEEVAGADAALPAWRAGLLRWPGHARLNLALGNQAYGRGELAVAISYYRQGLAAAAQDPALSNNLASALAEMGCPQAGIELLQPVAATLADDSDWRRVIGATLAELVAAEQATPAFCAALMPVPVSGHNRQSRRQL